jgi:hypothetical protein
MKRGVPEHFLSGAGVVREATAVLRYWSFPLIVMLGWMLATTYTLVLLSRGPAPVQAAPVQASPTSVPSPIAAVQPMTLHPQIPIGG